MNKNVFRNLSYGVYIISTWDNGRPTGCVANSAMQITSEPATVAISINHDNYTNGCIKESGKFALSIMSENSRPATIGTFGYQSGREADKFAQIPYEVKEYMPIIADSCGYITCQVLDTMETATHTIFLAEVTGGDVLNADTPMTYAYYHKVVKAAAPKNAPTYIAE